MEGHRNISICLPPSALRLGFFFLFLSSRPIPDSTSSRRRPATWTRSTRRGGRGGASPASCQLDLQPQPSWSEDHRPPALPDRFSPHHPLPGEINYAIATVSYK